MKNSGFLAVALILVLAGAGCSRSADNSAGSSVDSSVGTQPTENDGAVNSPAVSTPSVAKTVTVNYTGASFSPATVSINAGDTVRFINTGQTAAVWPAANPHPIHTSVPGFDAQRPLETGGSYEFTFTKTGTFSYHNHLNPAQTGTVIVK